MLRNKCRKSYLIDINNLSFIFLNVSEFLEQNSSTIPEILFCNSVARTHIKISINKNFEGEIIEELVLD